MVRSDAQAAVPLFDMAVGDSALKEDLGLSRIYILTLPSSTDPQEALSAFSADPAVEYAELDFVGYGADTPDDERFGQQWNLHNTGQSGGEPDADVDAPEAWDISVGVTSTVLAIIDTGIDLDHPDLAERVVPGYDFVNSDATPQDDHGHGTHVAGIAAAVTNNTIGVAGVCPRCRIMPLKALNSSNWGYYSWWADAIAYAVDHDADVINMSMGGTSYSQVLRDAVLYAYAADVPIVAAMMNDGDSILYYPAAFAETIAVGSTDHHDNRSSFSNFGDHIDLVAPGTSIWSTMWDDTYASWSGTSMATPHVVGVLGLVHSVRPGYTVEELRAILRATADDQVGPPNEDKEGWDIYFGSGRLNAARAVQYVVPPDDVVVSGPTTGLVLADYTLTAIVSPVTAAQPITYIWQAAGQSPLTHTDGLSDTAVFAWPTSGTQTITLTATNLGGTVTGTHAIAINAPSPGAVLTVCHGVCDYDSIQDAVDAASDGNIIKVAAGTYTGVNNYGNLAQTVYISKSVTIRGGYTTAFTDPPDPDANLTTIDAQAGGRVLYITGDVTPTIEGLCITGGDAAGLGGGLGGGDAGGGIYVFNARATIGGNQVLSNTARWGGGLYLWESDATISGNTITANSARWGGGLYLENNSAATLIGNTVAANTSDKEGSGLYLMRSDATLVNNVIADNQANTSCGGLYIRQSSPRLLHTTFVRNGGGVCVTGEEDNYSTVALANTILVSHTAGITVTAGNTVTLEATLWGDDTWANIADWEGAGTVITGTGNYWGDPAFVDPTTGDYHIQPTSMAVDAGIDAGITTDIDGQLRPQGNGYDVGADETPPHPSLAAYKWAAPNPVQAGAQLTYTIHVTNTGNATLTATITDALPEHVAPGGVLTWTPAPIAPGDTWMKQFAVTVEMGYTGLLTNVVEVITEEGATGVHTTTSQAEVTPALAVAKQVAPNLVQAGAQLTYTIHVTNTGNATLTATITDVLPEHVAPGGVLTWTPAPIAPGDTWMKQFAVTAEMGCTGLLTNVVWVTTGEGASGMSASTALVVEREVTVSPSQGGVIVALSADGMTTTVEIPPGAVTRTTQLAYTSAPLVSGSPPGFVFAGRAFRLEAYRNGALQPSLVFEEPVIVTIHYAAANVAGLDENTLELRYWDGNGWSTDGVIVVERDTVRRKLVARIEHLSEFAVFAQEQQEAQRKTHLPLMLRQYR